MVRKFLILLFILFSVSSVHSDSTNVLFVGNSYTYFNDLPTLFANLSAYGGKRVYADMYAPGGYTLQEHKTDSLCLSKIKLGYWNYVILQEQSQTPVIDTPRFMSMYPSAIWLDSLIRSYNGNTAFYMTWGRKYGGQQCLGAYCSPLFVNFFHMQDSMKVSYKMISDSLNAILCPVGEAWRRAKVLDSSVDLWQSDYSHPTLEGSYLAACVFYAAIFHSSPVGISYTGGLSPSDALFCQQCAWYAYTGINYVSSEIPDNYYLEQNYPNPFNAETRIRFSIPAGSKAGLKAGIKDEKQNVKLIIYDLLGRNVEMLVNTSFQPGVYEIKWNALKYPTGVYYCVMSAGNFTATKKLMLLK